MTTINFDTLEYSNSLQDAGVPQGQAEAIATAQSKALREVINAQHFATKTDIFEVRAEIQTVRTELKEDIQNVRMELKEEIQNVRMELKEEIQNVRTELKEEIQNVRTELKEDIANTKHEIIKWMTSLIVALFIAQGALFVGIVAFMK